MCTVEFSWILDSGWFSRDVDIPPYPGSDRGGWLLCAGWPRCCVPASEHLQASPSLPQNEDFWRWEDLGTSSNCRGRAAGPEPMAWVFHFPSSSFEMHNLPKLNYYNLWTFFCELWQTYRTVSGSCWIQSGVLWPWDVWTARNKHSPLSLTQLTAATASKDQQWNLQSNIITNMTYHHRISSYIVIYHQIALNIIKYHHIISYHQICSCIITYHYKHDISSYIIISHQISSHTFIYHHISSYIITYHHKHDISS